jgi:hypothetical protein
MAVAVVRWVAVDIADAGSRGLVTRARPTVVAAVDTGLVGCEAGGSWVAGGGRARGAVFIIYAREDLLPNTDVRGRVVFRARVTRSFRPPTRPAGPGFLRARCPSRAWTLGPMSARDPDRPQSVHGLHPQVTPFAVGHDRVEVRGSAQSARALSSRSRHVVANGAPGASPVNELALRWRRPSHSGSSSRRSTGQQR